MIRFGNQNFYFGGDVENSAINMIEEERLHNILFIKIPHHSSKTSDALPLLLNSIKASGNMTDAVSVSTSFVNSKTRLPEFNVLNKYCLFSSKILITDKDKREKNYGIWKFVYNISPQIIEQPIPLGDASEYSSN